MNHRNRSDKHDKDAAPQQGSTGSQNSGGDAHSSAVRAAELQGALSAAKQELAVTQQTLDRTRAQQHELEARVQELETQAAIGGADTAELQHARTRLVEFESELESANARSDQAASDANEQVEAAQAAVDRVQTELETARESSQNAERDLRSRIEAINAELETAQAQADEASGASSSLTEQVEAGRTEVGELQAELERHRQQTAEANAQSEQNASRIEALHAELESTRAQADEASGASSSLTEQVEAGRSEVGELQAELERQREQAAEGNTQSEQLASRVEELSAELKAECARSGEAGTESAEQLKAAVDSAEQLQSELDSMLESSVEAEGKFRDQISELTASLESTREAASEADEAGKAAVDRSDAKQSKITELEGKLETECARAGSLEDDKQELQGKMEALDAKLDEALADEQSLEQSNAKVASLELELKMAHAKCEQTVEVTNQQRQSDQAAMDSLKEELKYAKAAAEGGDAALKSQIEEMSSHLAAAKSDAEQVRSESVSPEQAQADEARFAELKAEFEKQSKSAAEVIERNHKLEAELLSARREAKKLGSQSAERSDEFNALRHKRLRRQKHLISKQSTKIAAAAKAVKDRGTQCDQIIEKRTDLAAAYQALQGRQKRFAEREIRSSSIMATACGVAVVGIVMWASWFASGQVAPGQYAASAVVVASNGTRELTDDSRAGWQEYIGILTEDPRFVEVVAERLKRRGITSLGDAGVLTTFLDKNLHIQSPQDGRLELELTGAGAAKTERLLDTLVVALASSANQTRSRRPDGASTVIEGRSEASNNPLDQRRLYAAGGIFGGALLIVFALGGVLWRRLHDTKIKFERDTNIEGLIEGTAWPEPSRTRRAA